MEINHRTQVLLRHLSHDGDKNKNQGQNDEVNQNNQDSQDWDNHNDNDNDNDNNNHHHDNNNNNNPTNNDNHHKKQKQWKEKYNLDLELFVQQLPKVELHVHLDGSFDPDVLWTYIQQHKPASLECLPEQTVLPWEDDDNDINDIDDDKNEQEKNEQEEEESLSRNILRVRDLVTQCQSRQEYHNLITCRTPPPPPPPRPLFHHKQQKQQQQRHDQGDVVVVHDHSFLQNPPQQRHRRRRSLKEMLKCFEIFLPTVRQNLPFLEHLAYDFCQRQWQQNCVYTEVRYSPFLLAENLNNTTTITSSSSYNNNDKKKKKKPVMVTGEDVFLCITRGLRRGCREFGNNNNNHRHQRITINQILCCITWRPDWAQPTLDLVKKYQHDYPCATVGIDIAAGEEHFDKERFPNLHYPHYNVIQQARRDGIPITLHAGEVPQQQDTHNNNNDNYYKKKNAAAAAENVRRSVQEYGASRIGHGYHMVLNHDLMMEMKQAGIHFEICPTSSVETGAWPGIITTTTSTTIQNMEEEEEKHEDDDNQRQESQRKQDKQQDMVVSKDWMKHPGRIMQLNHMSISLNSDDPAVFHTSLAWQYRIALVKMGMNQYDLYQSNLNAINAAFCDDETKQQIRQQIHEFWQQQQQQHYNEEEDDKNKNDKDNKAVVSQSNKEPVVVVNRSLYKNHAMSHSANELPTTNNNNNNQSDHHPQQQQQPSQLFYRRSVSENFADRVYLETLDYDNDYDDDDENFNDDDHVKYNDVEEEETNNVQKERIRVVFT